MGLERTTRGGEDDEISGGCVCWKWRVFEMVMLKI